MCRSIKYVFLLFLVLVACTKNPQESRKNLYELWIEGVKSYKEDFEQTDAIIEFFSLKWKAISYDVMGDKLLEDCKMNSIEKLPWPLNNSSRPYEEQERRANYLFYEKYGLEPPPFFPPALDAYKRFKPPWAEGTNNVHWLNELKRVGIASFEDLSYYLEKGGIVHEVVSKQEADAMSDSLEKEIYLILAEFPGTRLEFLDKEAFYLEIFLCDFLVLGTDYACSKADDLFYSLCSLENGEFIIKATNEWVPSSVNPMDLNWVKYLSNSYGFVTEFETIKEYQDNVYKKLKARGILRD